MNIVNGRRLDYGFSKKHSKSVLRAPLNLRFGSSPTIPDIVDLRSFCSDPEDQGTESSCSAHAAAGAYEFLQMMEFVLNNPIVNEEYAPLSKIFKRTSRNFIYYNERALDGDVNKDSGVTDLIDACEVLTSLGSCREELWPYSQDTLFTKPSDAAFADAAIHKISGYAALNASDLRMALHSGSPFMLGFQVYESFMSDTVAQTGWMPIPQAGEQIVGGHAVLAVGYNNYQRAFIVRNSWGAKWGAGGYFYFPYKLMFDPNMANDFFVLQG